MAVQSYARSSDAVMIMQHHDSCELCIAEACLRDRRKRAR
jgi:hypothetical protein